MTGFLNLTEMLKANARRYGRHTAFLYGQKKVSYKQLDEVSDGLASGLVRLGIERGQRIALLLFNRPEFVISYFGILKAGCSVVPINTMLKADEIKYMLEDAGCVAMITSTSFLDMAVELRLRLDCLKHVILLSRTKHAETTDFHELIESKLYDRRILQDRGLRRLPGETAVIMYTSGTMGRPKGAMLTHRNLISNAISSAKSIRISRRDNFLCILPLFHSFAATVCMLLPIICGAKITIFVSPRPFKRVLSAVIRRRVTIFTAVPSIYNILKDAKLPAVLTAPLVSKLINPLKLCISGAAALPVETLKSFEKKFKIPLIEGYGLTEASPVVSLNPIRGARKPGSIGLPLPDVKVKVVDNDGKELERDQVGELLVKGPNVMKGYLNQPQATAETIKDDWLYTGDLARMDTDGYIYIVGRKKEMVNVRGFNVYPREIEDILYQHPLVKEAAVIGVPDQHKGEVPKGFVVLKEEAGAPGHQGTRAPDDAERELLHYLRERLASYKIPRRIEIRESLPKNATGKILKRELS